MVKSQGIEVGNHEQADDDGTLVFLACFQVAFSEHELLELGSRFSSSQDDSDRFVGIDRYLFSQHVGQHERCEAWHFRDDIRLFRFDLETRQMQDDEL